METTVVRAKLVCTKVSPEMSGEGDNAVKNGELVTFDTLYDTKDSPEDNTFSASTPSARFAMLVSNPDLYGEYKEGKAYYFDIFPCE